MLPHRDMKAEVSANVGVTPRKSSHERAPADSSSELKPSSFR